MKYSILCFTLLSFFIIVELNAQSTRVEDIVCPQADQLFGDFLEEASAFWMESDGGALQEKMARYEKFVNKYKLRIRMAYCQCFIESTSDSATIISVQKLYNRLQAELKTMEGR